MDPTKSETTPTPWKLGTTTWSGATMSIDIGVDGHLYKVGSLSAVLPNDRGPLDADREQRLAADAELIVSAVNSITTLVEALRREEALDNIHPDVVERILAALTP